MAGALLELDVGDRHRCGPAESTAPLKLLEGFIRQRDDAAQVWVLGVVEHMIVKDPVRADAGKHLGPVDQHSSVPLGDEPIGLTEVGWASKGEAVEIPSQNEVVTGLVPGAQGGEQPAEAIVGLGEFRVLFRQAAVGGNRCVLVVWLGSAGGLEFASECRAPR